jgi:hypothetical protein
MFFVASFQPVINVFLSYSFETIALRFLTSFLTTLCGSLPPLAPINASSSFNASS